MQKLLIHVAEGERRVVAVNTVYCAEAVRGNTLIRRRAARAILDIRELGEVERAWRRYGFVRIHDQHLVHPDRILRIKKRDNGRNWEVQLAPPVNRVLPVSRRRVAALWSAFEG